MHFAGLTAGAIGAIVIGSGLGRTLAGWYKAMLELKQRAKAQIQADPVLGAFMAPLQITDDRQ